MNYTNSFSTYWFLLGFTLLLLGTHRMVVGQTTTSSVATDLKKTILRQDSLLFAAFNHQDFVTFSKFFSKDLEVYQDNVGVRNYQESMEAFQNLFQLNSKLSRSLNVSETEVYPIKGFGAIETGTHTFVHQENGQLVRGTFKFVHIWKEEHDSWKLTRIITYDH